MNQTVPRLSKLPFLIGDILLIAATIYVDRDSQKGIIIGSGGQRLKQVGTEAREEMESLFGRKVFLQLHVKVRADWRQSDSFLDALDWRRQSV